MYDDVNNPAHYTHGGIECIEAIKVALGEGFEFYCIGCVMKYIWRYRYKGAGIQDLEKARKYLDWAIGERKEKETVR